MAQSALPEAHQILLIAQDQHRIVVDAIENREGARAEAVMREHSRLAARNLRLAIRNARTSICCRCSALLEIVRRIEATMRFAEQWSWCTVEPVRDVTPTMREFTLRPENGRVLPYLAGSHLGVTVLIDGQPARRSYSLVRLAMPIPIASPCSCAPTAAAARAACGACRPGTRIEISIPTTLSKSTGAAELLLIAGGIGITPIDGMAAGAGRRRNATEAAAPRRQSPGDAPIPRSSRHCSAIGYRHATDEVGRLDLTATFRRSSRATPSP